MDEDCGCGMHHRRHESYCGCGVHGDERDYRRHFFTKAEKLEKLKSYAEELKSELEAVEERIKEMQG